MRVLRNKFNSMLLCMMLIVAMAFTTAGCADKETKKDDVATENAQSTKVNSSTEQENVQDIETAGDTESMADADGNVLGEGSTKFTFEVVDGEGNQTNFVINTDKETVGEALLDQELIAGEDSDYGLYVKTVNGITADYDTDGSYWAFYVNGEYASSGVDSTPVADGDTYSFKVEK